MFLTVSFNPALDKTFFVPQNTPGTTIRATRVIDLAGGKGVNVARALRALGAEVQALAPLGGHSGAHLAELAEAEGIPVMRVPVRGQTRLALTFMAEGDSRYLHYLEPGPELSPVEVRSFRASFTAALLGMETVILSGSLPGPAVADLPEWMLRTARSAGLRVALDSFGPLSRRALEAGPWMAKPTEEEWISTTGEPLESEEARWQALERMATWGIRMAVLTRGAQGALALLEGSRYRVTPPAVREVNDLGAGDSFTAGFCWAAGAGKEPQECLRWATACGASNVQVWDPGRLERTAVEMLLPHVRIEAL